MSNKDELNIPSEQIETKEEIKELQENNEKKEEEEVKTEEKKEESKPEEKKENENEEEKEKSDDEEKEKSEEEKESDSGSEESKNSGSAGSGESKKKKDKEEENEEDDEDDEDDDIDVDDDDDVGSEESSSESKQKDPYHGYLNSKTDYKSFYSDICRDDYLYGYKQNKFYKIMGSKSDKKAPVYTFELKEIKVGNKNTKKNLKLTKNMQYMASLYGKLIKDDKKEEKKDEIKIDKKEDKKDVKKEELTNEIKEEKNDEVKGDLKEEKKEDNKEGNSDDKKEEKKEDNKDEPKEDNKEEKKEDNKEEQKDKSKDKKEKEKDKKEKEKEKNTKKNKKPKNTNLKEVIRDFSEYTFFQKIRIIYLNSLNNPVVFYHKININCSIKEIVNQFLSLYHFKHEKYSDKVPLFFFINGKKHSTSNRTRNKFFIPTKFDYKNDYVLILEKQNLKLKEFDLGTRSNYLNLRGALIPHVVYNSLYNFDIDSFIISKDLVSLECQIFEFKKEINIRQHTDNERTIKQKLKDILDLNWKEKSNLIATIKSVKVQKSKDNYNANLFELSRRFIMPQGKIYIFLIKSSYKKLYAFCGRHISSEGIFIVSKNDKSLLNGFRGKTMSDFVAYS